MFGILLVKLVKLQRTQNEKLKGIDTDPNEIQIPMTSRRSLGTTLKINISGLQRWLSGC